ncbi:hypothetical protein VNO77_42217 [Canavalia gladiata]|uniref:Uncharacterized protein n=1 Tax=Canavalia gladiata TaxID=3824 RepID=A0AAN9PT70_CANGL
MHSSKNVKEPKAKAALIWMLGDYSQDMHDAPYVLESLVENWDEEHSAEDVHDMALFYYQLLQYNVSVAERVVNPPKQTVSVFADTQSSEIKDYIFDEFNSLSIVYQKSKNTREQARRRNPTKTMKELRRAIMEEKSRREDEITPHNEHGRETTRRENKRQEGETRTKSY